VAEVQRAGRAHAREDALAAQLFEEDSRSARRVGAVLLALPTTLLLLLLFSSALGVILAPMISFSYRVIGTVFQI